MKLKPQTTVWLSIALVTVGIGITMATGLWQTESNKIPRALPTPAVVTASDYSGSTTVQYDPADIRGSYKFGEVSNLYGIPLEVLAQAFGIPQDDVEAFQVKGLEALYPDAENEIGTASVRLFTACFNTAQGVTTGLKVVAKRNKRGTEIGRASCRERV